MVAFSLAQPITYLILFAPFLKVVMVDRGASSYADAYRIYVPGLFVAMGLFGGLFAGYGLPSALRAGIIDRCRVTPVSRTGLLLGRALMHVCLNVVQAVVVTLVALPFGLRVHLANLLVSYALLSVMVLLSTSISYDIALLVRNENSLGVLVNTVGQPVSLLAGVLIPLVLAPMWIQRVAVWNPFAWATDGMVRCSPARSPRPWCGRARSSCPGWPPPVCSGRRTCSTARSPDRPCIDHCLSVAGALA
ncbi:ABC transporter permease [Micromonospora sp. BRA006-A]|nr:ABC transporter permease [Micromonospora sp. BRA006-A]